MILDDGSCSLDCAAFMPSAGPIPQRMKHRLPTQCRRVTFHTDKMSVIQNDVNANFSQPKRLVLWFYIPKSKQIRIIVKLTEAIRQGKESWTLLMR